MDMRVTEIIQSLDGSLQQLIILPTEKCNFRCTYCYEDFSLGRMTPETVSGIKALIQQRACDLRHLRISWFGGEPLLAKDIITDIMQYANELASRGSFAIDSSIATNAYLLSPSTLEKLCSLKVLMYQITLDGPEPVHNRTRKLAGGRGTFARIFSNIESIHKSTLPVRVTLRVHYSEENYKQLPELLSRLSALCKTDDRFAVHLKSVENLGGPQSHLIGEWTTKRRTSIKDELSWFIEGYLIDVDEYICYASKANSLVIRSNGSLAKCTVQFDNDKNNLGRITKEGLIEIDQNKVHYWTRGLFSGRQDELSCPAYS